MNITLAFFITWTTYGTWLHGDRRGSYFGRLILEPDEELEESMRNELKGDPVYLTEHERELVERTIERHCQIRGWKLHARNARTNHVHAIISANVDPKVIRTQLKAWCSRILSENEGLVGKGKNGQTRWWTEKGNIRRIESEADLSNGIVYVVECQD